MNCRISLKLNEFLFFSAWLLFLMTLLLGSAIFSVNNNTLELLFKLIRYFAYAICLIKIANTKMKKNTIILLFFVFLSFAICYIKSKNMTMPLYSFILLASLDINGEKVIKITTWIQGTLLAIIVALSQVGIIQDYIFDAKNRVRHGLGFSWTTTGAILYFYFMLCIIYLIKDRFKIIYAVIFEGINLWFYIMTDSRMAFFLSSCFILFFTIQIFNKRKWVILSKFNFIYIAFPWLMFAFTLIIYKLYNNQSAIWNSLNTLLSGRLYLGSSAIKNYGFSLLGKNIEWIGFSISTPTIATTVGYNYVDSSYLQLSLNYGFIFIFTVLTIYSYAIYKAVKIKDYYMIMVFLFILVFALTEPRLINFAFNPFPLLAFCNIDPETSLAKKTTGYCCTYRIKLPIIYLDKHHLTTFFRKCSF